MEDIIIGLVGMILFIITFLFIWIIKNVVISIEFKLNTIIQLLQEEFGKTTEKVVASKPAPDGMKYCGHFGELNGRLDKTCVKCGWPV